MATSSASVPASAPAGGTGAASGPGAAGATGAASGPGPASATTPVNRAAPTPTAATIAKRGLAAIVRKEIGDHLTGWRFGILATLVLVTGIAALYVAGQTIRGAASAASELEFVFLRLFTTTDNRLPPFISFIGFLGPLLGIALGFDAISGEQSQRTLSRLAAQPVRRDSIINAKFIAGTATIAGLLLCLWLLVGSLGLLMTGVLPTADEVLRLMGFYLLTVVYVAFWLALALVASIVFRQAATAALACIAVWLFFTVFYDLLAGLVASAFAPNADTATVAQLLSHERFALFLQRLSPANLYSEAISTLLIPSVRVLGPVLTTQVIGALEGTLPFMQSLLLVWPHVTGLIAATMICFAVAYVLFMRREIRA